jgi:tubulin--tyrosine ligase-like protein 12
MSETSEPLSLTAFLARGSHAAQLASFPPSLLPFLYAKLYSETFDAGDSLSIEELPDGTRRAVALRSIAANSTVWLVDHAWTFSLPDAHSLLAAHPPLLQRVAAACGVLLDGEGELDEDVDHADEGDDKPLAVQSSSDTPALELVLASAFRLMGSYRALGESEATFFLPDELGCALRHSSSPGWSLLPFLFTPAPDAPHVGFSLLWPLTDVCEGDECRRDFFAQVQPTPLRPLLEACFFQGAAGRVEGQCQAAWRDWLRSEAACAAAQREPAALSARSPQPQPARPLRVFSDVDWVVEDLRRPDFAIVAQPGEADVIWTIAPLDAAVAARMGAQEAALLNQFSGEECLVFKHLLPITLREAVGASGPHGWLPRTFNLRDPADLAALIGAHRTAEAAGESPLWIVKPWNAGRSQDVAVCSSLQAVARASLAGERIAQVYIAAPMLFKGRKLDLRLLLLVTSFDAAAPAALVWREAFVRCANRPYSTSPSALGDFQTSFTSMRQRGFAEDSVSEAQLAEELLAAGVDYEGVTKPAMHAMLRSIVAQAAQRVGGQPRCRALYGVDCMLDEGGRPKLLEVTFQPGVERPSERDTHFMDKLFGSAFLGEEEGFCRL